MGNGVLFSSQNTDAVAAAMKDVTFTWRIDGADVPCGLSMVATEQIEMTEGVIVF